MALRLVGECLPRNWLAKGDSEFLTHILIHLINEIEHGEIELEIELLAKTCDVVEAVGIVSTEMNGNHVALILNTLRDEGLLPREVANRAVVLLA